MQRNFEPMRKQVEAWQRCELTDVTAKVVIYEAFVEGKLEVPKHLGTVHDLCMSRSMRSSGRERSGVSRMRSTRHSRNWSRSHSSRPPPSWESFWKLASPSRSKLHLAVSAGPPIVRYSILPVGVAPTLLRPLSSRKFFHGQSVAEDTSEIFSHLESAVQRDNCAHGWLSPSGLC
jgi:hypothetical protein